MNKIKRYVKCQKRMIESNEGSWVRWEDVEAQLEDAHTDYKTQVNAIVALQDRLDDHRQWQKAIEKILKAAAALKQE